MTDTKCIGCAVVGGKPYVLLVSPFTDGTAAEITIRDATGNLKAMKNVLAGKIMTSFWLTVGTPSDLDLIQFKADDGGIVYEWGGCIDAALGHNPDVVVEGISARITKGSAFEGTTSD